ncbi:hypothetical protein [Chamaesiphon sp.]|uniref:hypothetical protein n=1 Tax=Chamaesiphon sp. TaxID=2814140 RepID=UPI003593B019
MNTSCVPYPAGVVTFIISGRLYDLRVKVRQRLHSVQAIHHPPSTIHHLLVTLNV